MLVPIFRSLVNVDHLMILHTYFAGSVTPLVPQAIWFQLPEMSIQSAKMCNRVWQRIMRQTSWSQGTQKLHQSAKRESKQDCKVCHCSSIPLNSFHDLNYPLIEFYLCVIGGGVRYVWLFINNREDSECVRRFHTKHEKSKSKKGAFGKIAATWQDVHTDAAHMVH